ncbi:tryptophan 2,3-dioxygenase family protein [Vulgatibacter incomptus]|uniref:Tryptophan 2,3-dioxygenase n=1 Tax=Vulgatibacter incomptus TaxID=1391653 RepID=A0A0K1PF52_9BACT|nr:tryptophan 2,3-dioxygenase family protein [Vulgatibacter incomptus]AKU92163.1 Tryptophan 2,3-dioxygenase [Vulgatibacter incomptus]
MAQPEGNEKVLTDYEKYIRTEELLALQKPPEACADPDELLFQVMHQVMELWMKTMFHETERVAGLLGQDELGQAAHHLRRTAKIEKLLADQLAIMETMAPADYHKVRLQSLGRGSGQQSPGFNRMLTIGEPVWSAFEKARERAGVDLVTLFAKPRVHWDLWLVVQGMMEVDEGFQAWRFHHYEMVKRIIGLEVKSLKDVPASQLRYGIDEAFFPELWKQVPVLTRSTRPEY